MLYEKYKLYYICNKEAAGKLKSSACVISCLCLCVHTLGPRPRESITVDHYPPVVGSHCQQSRYGCCADGHTSATGPRNRGCPGGDCIRTRYTCYSLLATWICLVICNVYVRISQAARLSRSLSNWLLKLVSSWSENFFRTCVMKILSPLNPLLLFVQNIKFSDQIF